MPLLLLPRARSRRTSGRPRRIVAMLAAAALVGLAVPRTLPAAADSSSSSSLQHAKQELRQTKERIRARLSKMRDLQRDLNRLATRISKEQMVIDRARVRMRELTVEIRSLDAKLSRLEAQLAERSREAYILGPGTPMLYLLTATSAAEAVSRISLLNEMSRRDAELAAQVGDVADQLLLRRGSLERLRYMREAAIRRLQSDRKALRRKMAESKQLYAELQVHKEQTLAEISRIRPFAVCPVAGPHAVADDFGIWVHRAKKWGGDHVHQGNDITAATGTPIVAPFDGLAVASPNKIGGQAVKVYGTYGYVYNAHLSAYGTLGQVQTGTVIGYVGSTGDAGGPHDHFEWHPGNGPAVDPNGFLMLVC